jgi:hypothetical protein
MASFPLHHTPPGTQRHSVFVGTERHLAHGQRDMSKRSAVSEALPGSGLRHASGGSPGAPLDGRPAVCVIVAPEHHTDSACFYVYQSVMVAAPAERTASRPRFPRAPVGTHRRSARQYRLDRGAVCFCVAGAVAAHTPAGSAGSSCPGWGPAISYASLPECPCNGAWRALVQCPESGPRRMRPSTTMAPCPGGSTFTGLRSSSRSSGRLSTRAETRRMTDTSAWRSAAGAPR